MMARAQFPAWSGRAYASRDDSDDSSYSYSEPRRSTRSSSREYARVRHYAAPRATYSSRSRETAESRPKSRTELQAKAAKTYDDLPRINTSKYVASQENVASVDNSQKREKAKSRPKVEVASHRPEHSVKESSRTSTREVAHRSNKSEKCEKAEGPVTASMFPGVGSSKKTKKESPTIARKPKENSKSKKKKSDS